MLPNGCFGSSLAFDAKSAACKACASRPDCQKIVNNRYPNLLKLLVRFSDGTGKQMAEYWLSPSDKKRLKERRKQMAKREAETAVFGSPAAAQQLRVDMSDEGARLFDRCIEARVNPVTADLAALARVSKPLGSAVRALRVSPQSRTTVENSIASDALLSATTAKRETKAVLSLLKRCGRITQHNNLLEIK